MKKFNKLITLMVGFVIFSISISPKVQAAASVSISAPSTVEVGKSVKITLNNNSNDYSVAGLLSITGAASGSLDIAMNGKDSQSITVTPKSNGTITVSFSGDSALIGPPFTKENLRSSKTISVKSPTTGGGGGSSTRPDGNTGENTGSYNPSYPNEETEAEKKARLEREREELLKTPLIEKFTFYSESERLKGEEVLRVDAKHDTFKYTATLPRNIEAFKLDITAVDEDVVLEYDKMYKLDEGNDKVEIVIKASKGDISQSYNLSVMRFVESEMNFNFQGNQYSLLVDSLIDSRLKEYGISYNVVDEKLNSYFYQYKNAKFILTYDEENKAHWFLTNDKLELVKEFVLTLDENSTPHFIVDVPIEEPQTLNGNRYLKTSLPLSEKIASLDSSVQFSDTVSAWQYEDASWFTHELVLASEDEELNLDAYQIVYLDNDSKIVQGFVNFDDSSSSWMYLSMILGALLVLMILIFVFYWYSMNKRINKIIARKNQI